MRFVWYRTRTVFGWRFRWHLKAGNNEIICHGESYCKLADCLHAIELVKGSKDAIVEEKRP